MKNKIIRFVSLLFSTVFVLGGCTFTNENPSDKPIKEDTPKSYFLKYYIDDSFYKSTVISTKEALTFPKEPEKEKYTFDGWYFDKETYNDKLTSSYFVGKTITKDYSVYAKFTKVLYDLTFMVDEEKYETISIKSNSTIDFPNEPTKEGYTFLGWFLDENYTTELTSDYFINKQINEDYTVFAKFRKDFLVLTYIVDGSSYTSSTVMLGYSITLPVNPTKPGYTFDGWYFDNDEWNNKLYSNYFVDNYLQEDLKVYAKFNLNVFTLIYVSDGEIYSSTDIYLGKTLTFPSEPTKPGYLFAGWYFDNNTFENELVSTYFKDTAIDKNYTVYAKFVDNEYTLTYYMDNNVYKISVISKVNPIILPNDPTLRGYAFEGWYFDNETFLNKLDLNQFIGQTIVENYKVYAHFERSLGVSIWAGSYHFSSPNGRQAVLNLLDAGVDTIININHAFNGNEQEFLSFCDFCYEKGMNLIIDPRDYQDGDFVPWDGTCPSYITKPAIIGLTGQDEPGYDEIDAVAARKAVFDADPLSKGKLFFLNLRSENFVVSADKVSYTKYLDAIFNKVNPEMISVDSYPLLENGDVFVEYFQTLSYCSYYSRIKHVPFFWNSCIAKHDSTSGALAMPTVDNISWCNFCGLTFGVTNITYYTFASHTGGYTCISNTRGEKLDLWSTFEEATSRLHSYEAIYQSYNYVGSSVYKEGNTNKLVDNIPSSHVQAISSEGTISSISTSSGDLICGLFRNKYTNKLALRVTNAGDYTSYSGHSSHYSFAMNKIENVTLTLSDLSVKSAKIIMDGKLTNVNVSSDKINFSLKPYSSAFIELVQ